MKLPKILPRLLERTKVPRRWWWPIYVRNEVSAEAKADQQHEPSLHFGEACLTIRRVLLAIVVYCCFCLFTLSVPDKDLLENKIVVPFANVEVNFFDFAIVGPGILVGLTIYLHIFVGYWRANQAKEGEPNSPFLFNMSGAVPRLLTTFLFYWLPPLVLVTFAYKIDPYTDTSLLPILTLGVLSSLIFLQIRRFRAKLRHSFVYRAMWTLFVFTSLFGILVTANRVATIDFGDTKTKTSEVVNAISVAALEMIGFEFVQLVQVGHVKFMKGEVTAMRANGEKVSLESGAPIFERDTVETGPDSAVSIAFADDSIFTVQANSTIVLDEYIYSRNGDIKLNIEAGVFRFVSGRIARRLPFRKLDVAGVDLTGIKLNRRNLRDANLTKSDLSEVNLSGVDLRGAILDGAILKGADLRSADLTNARLVKATLANAKLTNARLESADLSGAELVGADLRAANLRRTAFNGANLRDTDFRGADLRGADLKNTANLTQAQLDGACGDNQTKLPQDLTIVFCTGFVPFTIKTPTATIGIRG